MHSTAIFGMVTLTRIMLFGKMAFACQNVTVGSLGKLHGLNSVERLSEVSTFPACLTKRLMATEPVTIQQNR